MKRINACASDAQLSFDLSNSLLTPSFHNSHLRNKFKLTPIAVACVCALCSLSANAARVSPEDFKSGLTDIQKNALEQIAAQDTGNNRWTIGGEIDLSEINVDFKSNLSKANDLIGFFREKDDNDSARVNITYLQPGGVKWYHIAGDEKGEVSGEITHPNSVVYFNKGDNTTAWDVRYNFADDGDNLGIPSTQDTSVLSFFDKEKISASVLSDLKIYIFEPQVNLISQNHLVGQNNSADSKADIGLSLSNKRKNITFNKEVNFISSFTFYDDGTYDIPVSGVNNAKIATGIYNAFGASDLESDISAEDRRDLRDLLFKKDSTETTDYANALGVITFNKYATVSVTHTNREEYSDKGKINEVFGVFNNEGGTTLFENGANIIAKGKQNDRIISAISSTGTKGILDPLKQGTINITGSDNGKTSFIWGISDHSEESNSNNDFIKPFAINDAYNFDIDTDWNNYFNQLNDSDNLELQYAVISLHGSNVNIKDTQNGAIDIRGDILSGTLNGNGATSNTVGHDNKKTSDSKWSDLSGVVIRSNVSINLENEKSVLYGNVYERHRITEDELVDNTHLNTAESFNEWQVLQLEQEKESLGGNVDLSLSNKATWYPQKNWKGWNNDFVYSNFEEQLKQLENLPDDGVINYDEINYKKIDFSDQYNLMVYENDKWSLKNESDISKFNDLNNKFSGEKQGEYTTVDNGIYHLALNDGGVVDTRYMRQDFNFSTVNDVIGNNMDYSQLDQGIKKLRIQELAGNGGTFNIFVKNNYNHDLIIIDQAKENSSPTISFNIWNGENNTDKNLGIIKGDESTFVQIGRVGKDIQFNKTIEIEPQYGDIQKITYTIEKDNENFDWTQAQYLEYHEAMNNLFITDYKFETAPEIIEGARMSSSLAYNYAIMDIDRLQKRRGEARYITQQDDGMWARYRHINSGLSGNDDSADVIQIGYDHKVRNEESYNVYSVAVDYLRGQSDFDQSGDSEMNRYSLAVYDTWLLDNGAYLDLTARVGYFDAEMNTSFRMPSNTFYNVDGNYNFWGATVGAEIGRKFSNKDQWFFEPQTQLTYTYIGGYDFNTSQGVKVESDSIDSVIMRWGLRVGKDFGTSAQDGLYSVYLMADALHDFLGQQELTVTGMSTGNSHVAKFDGEQTWYDIGIGFSCTLNENSYIFLNYERSLGHSIDNTWEANAGVSVVF